MFGFHGDFDQDNDFDHDHHWGHHVENLRHFKHKFGDNWEKPNDLRRSVAAVVESIMQAGRYGSPEQVKAVQDLLTKTNQEIHNILARDSE